MTPSAPSLARIAKSDSFPSTGVWSNLKSPVWTTTPTGVRRAIPIASGIEWPIRKATTPNGPIWSSSPGSRATSGIVVELVLLDLVAKEPAGEGRGVDRHARKLGQHVRQRADMVLVGVGDEEGLDLGLVLLEVGDVGDDEVDPEHLLVGEHQAAVDHDDLVAVLEHVHVLADLADAAERDDAKGVGGISHEGVSSRSEQREVGFGVLGDSGGAAGMAAAPSTTATAPTAATAPPLPGRRPAEGLAARPLARCRVGRAIRAAPPGYWRRRRSSSARSRAS